MPPAATSTLCCLRVAGAASACFAVATGWAPRSRCCCVLLLMRVLLAPLLLLVLLLRLPLACAPAAAGTISKRPRTLTQLLRAPAENFRGLVYRPWGCAAGRGITHNACLLRLPPPRHQYMHRQLPLRHRPAHEGAWPAVGKTDRRWLESCSCFVAHSNQCCSRCFALIPIIWRATLTSICIAAA